MPTLEELKEQQRRQWSGNAATWDAQHERRERESGPVSAWLCREAGLAPGMRVLDLACGSGHPALDAARLVSPDGKVIATDMVPEMVAVTRRRADEYGLSGVVETRVMDAEAIDLPQSSLDAVTCRFGLMFCTRPSDAVAGVFRVLKEGGRFAVAVWAPPDQSPGQTVGSEALRRFGRAQPAPDFDAPGIYQLAPEGKLEGLLRDAGFQGVRIEPVTISEYESFDAFLAPGAMRMGSLRTAMDQLSPDDAERLKSILADVLQPYTASDGTIRLPLTVLCAVASKPGSGRGR